MGITSITSINSSNQTLAYRGLLIVRYPDGATLLVRHVEAIRTYLNKFAREPKGMNVRFEWEDRVPWLKVWRVD